MKTNQAGLDLIKEFEGFRGHAYLCPAGVYTVGYGHTSRAGPPIVRPDTYLSKKDAETILQNDLRKYEMAVEDAIAPWVTVTENQYSALVSLCYNIGQGALTSSSVIRRLNEGKVKEAADAFLMWNKGGGRVLPGLVRRRKAERKLFLED